VQVAGNFVFDQTSQKDLEKSEMGGERLLNDESER